ncbi:MAG: hypothetical protein JXX14_24645 [Deltaproteobacteria bacterium]|nr:hypothetical protein [Deltaproteobacteria bacterium]
MRQTSKTSCSVFPSETIYIGSIPLPAASEIELVQQKRKFVWNGKVNLGDAAVISNIEVFAGDGAFFIGNLTESPKLSQVRLGSQREVAGNWYPAGSIINLTSSGQIGGITASIPPDDLSTQQALYLKQKAERQAQCETICAPHQKDPAAQASCLEYCMNQ